jgi:uncharacterized membrane protein YeaQ/YmgE (transglycosylase-associated protein family)
MNFFGFLVLLVVAAFCGSIGAALAGYSGRGYLTSIILGFIGALIGTWFSKILGIGDFLYYHSIPIFWSIVGSAIFVAVVSLLAGNKRRKRS